MNAASKFCVGGICRYKAKPKCGVTNNWLANEIAPGITASFGPGIGKILGAALLWASYDPSMIDSVPDDICHSVVPKFILLKSTLPDKVNSIDKILIVANEIDGTGSLDKKIDSKQC